MIWKIFTSIDSRLKFPNLKPGEIGIQLGFDMTSYLTSDLFSIYKRVKPSGKIIGIDPDPSNHNIAKEIIKRDCLSIDLVQKGTYSKASTAQFLFGDKSSWNQIDIVPVDSTVTYSGKKIEVSLDTLDHIINELRIDIQQIGHINLTINGAEYDTLLGMDHILRTANNLSLTVIAGRHDESGIINGKQDYEMIIPLLQSYGFQTKFKRINELFWWGFIVKGCLNRKWVYGKPNFGVIMAGKGNKQIKWYQSFS